MLKKAKKAENIDELKRFLSVDVIPAALLIKEEFWKKFQDDLDILYDMHYED